MKPGVKGIYIGSGVSARTREPFCHVTVQLTDGKAFEGQLKPATVREMALGWLEAAEGAIHDAAVFEALTDEIGLGAEVAAQFLANIREHRQDASLMTDVPEGDE